LQAQAVADRLQARAPYATHLSGAVPAAREISEARYVRQRTDAACGGEHASSNKRKRIARHPAGVEVSRRPFPMQWSFMDWDRIQANWQHYKVIARVRWGRISADEFDLIAGRREALTGQIEELYRVSSEMAQQQVASWQGQQQEPRSA